MFWKHVFKPSERQVLHSYMAKWPMIAAVHSLQNQDVYLRYHDAPMILLCSFPIWHLTGKILATQPFPTKFGDIANPLAWNPILGAYSWHWYGLTPRESLRNPMVFLIILSQQRHKTWGMALNARPARQALGGLRYGVRLLKPFGGFHSHGGTPNGWFIMENPHLKWIILGCSYFRKPPFKPTLMFNPEGQTSPGAARSITIQRRGDSSQVADPPNESCLVLGLVNMEASCNRGYTPKIIRFSRIFHLNQPAIGDHPCKQPPIAACYESRIGGSPTVGIAIRISGIRRSPYLLGVPTCVLRSYPLNVLENKRDIWRWLEYMII